MPPDGAAVSWPQAEAGFHALFGNELDIVTPSRGQLARIVRYFDHITFYAQPLELAFLLPRAHLVITSGVATTTTALLIGLPILSVPRTLEQHVVAHALERTGAAKAVEGDFSGKHCLGYW